MTFNSDNLAKLRTLYNSYSYVKGRHKVGGSGDDVFEFQVRQSPVAVNVALFQNFSTHGSHLFSA